MRVVFATGGTGGHLYPAIAVAEKMQERAGSFQPLFVGNRSGMELIDSRKYGFRSRSIISRSIRGRSLPGVIATLISLAAGTVQSLFILARFKPDLVMGFGGYASAAVVIASVLLRRRIVLQEQNSIPGTTNRLLARTALRIYLGFENAGRFLGDREAEKSIFTGNPLRRDITSPYSGDARKAFGLRTDIPVLLVFGGSQGARSLSRAAAEYFLENPQVQGIIQTGRAEYGRVAELLSGVGSRVFIAEYISNIREAYEAADMALARAGALSVSELAAVGLPSILVPYPHATDDHQTLNARYLEEGGGAVLIKDRYLYGDGLNEVINKIIDDKSKLESMGRAAKEKGIPGAASLIVDDIEKLLAAGKIKSGKDSGGGEEG